MGLFTNLTVSVIRKTDQGSNYFGVCDVCGIATSETVIGTSYPVYKKDAEDVYYLGGAFGGGTYGHEKCIRSGYPNAIPDENIRRVGNLRVLPYTSILDVMRVGMNVGTFHPYRRDMVDAA